MSGKKRKKRGELEPACLKLKKSAPGLNEKREKRGTRASCNWGKRGKKKKEGRKGKIPHPQPGPSGRQKRGDEGKNNVQVKSSKGRNVRKQFKKKKKPKGSFR